jgi:hypothetical protein
MLFVIRYTEKLNLYLVLTLNLELGTWNIELLSSVLCRPSSVICPLSLRVVGSYGRSVNSVIGQLVNS